ncbi:MAG: hypothetical protein JRF25_02505 [Deltaproteobacteria bacterium]|nr:hypothetical protein [Deltaproteobacteria bacterium]
MSSKQPNIVYLFADPIVFDDELKREFQSGNLALMLIRMLRNQWPYSESG